MSTSPNKNTRLILWHDLVTESMDKSGLQFSDSVSHYLTLTLETYSRKIEIVSNVLAIQYLENIRISNTANAYAIRDVADQCLILAGLFPDSAMKKRVSRSYYSDLGMQAYYILSYAHTPWQDNRTLFYQLFENFSDLISVLHQMRTLNNYSLQ